MDSQQEIVWPRKKYHLHMVNHLAEKVRGRRKGGKRKRKRKRGRKRKRKRKKEKKGGNGLRRKKRGNI
jgi:hypothetical protein